MTIPTWPNAKPALEAFDLTGKRALVVGAAKGAGRSIALGLAEVGCDLALTTTTSAADEALALRRTAREARDTGRTVIEQSVDASSGQGAQVMVRQIAKQMGGIDIVVNAPDLFLAKPASADATELRKQVQDMVSKNEAKVLETQITVARSGRKATSESIHEFIYPTEYERLLKAAG